MNKIKSRTGLALIINCLLFSHLVIAKEKGVFSSSEVSTLKEVDKIDYDQKYQFILKKMFDVKGAEQQLYSRKTNKGVAQRYLNRYQSQGRFADKKEKEIPVDQLVSQRASKDTYKGIHQQIKENLKHRGFISFSKKSKRVKSITDYKRVTNSFFETNLRDALNEVSQQVNIPFLMDDSIQGAVTVRFNNTPLDEALDMLLVAGGFDYVENNKYILIGFPQSSSPIFKRLSKTKVLHPVYAKPTEIKGLLSSDYSTFVKFNDENNTIVVTAQPDMLERIISDISTIDHRPAQMMLEVLIADITTSAKRKIGRDFWSDKTSGMGTFGGTPFNVQSSTDSGFTFNIVGQDNVSALNLQAAAALGVALPNGVSILRYFTGVFNAMEDTGEARVWATPSVVATDGKMAIIDITTEQIIPIVSGPTDFLQVTTKVYNSGVGMQIVPRISSNGEINLEIKEIQVSTVSFTGERQSTGDRLPVLTKRKISTSVSLNNQETLIIGGLLDVQHGDQGKNFPGMKELSPVVGTEKQTRETRDLLIFITPTLLQEHKQIKKVEDFLS